jgi:hypothetical protein
MAETWHHCPVMPNVDRPARAVALWLQRWRLLAGLASTVLLMHLLLLAGLRSGQAAQARPAAAVVSVRQIVQLPTPRPLPAPPSAVDQAAVPRPPRPPAPAPAPAQPQPQPQSQPPPADTVAPQRSNPIRRRPSSPPNPPGRRRACLTNPAADKSAADETATYATRLLPAACCSTDCARPDHRPGAAGLAARPGQLRDAARGRRLRTAGVVVGQPRRHRRLGPCAAALRRPASWPRSPGGELQARPGCDQLLWRRRRAVAVRRTACRGWCSWRPSSRPT